MGRRRNLTAATCLRCGASYYRPNIATASPYCAECRKVRTGRKTTSERGYGHRYQVARAALLRGNPLCEWCRARPATTADHDPPLEAVAEAWMWKGRLVPACGPCNLGRRGRRPEPGPEPGRPVAERPRSRVW